MGCRLSGGADEQRDQDGDDHRVEGEREHTVTHHHSPDVGGTQLDVAGGEGRLHTQGDVEVVAEGALTDPGETEQAGLLTVQI